MDGKIAFATCTKCNDTKCISEFYLRADRIGHKRWCKVCVLEYGREYRKRASVKIMRNGYYIKRKRNKAQEISKNGSDYHARLKLLCLSKYSDSGEPVCQHPDCNVSDIDMLTIDHINNDGAEHRKMSGATSTYLWLKKKGFPDGFETLCMNHNFKKGLEHRRKNRLCGV